MVYYMVYYMVLTLYCDYPLFFISLNISFTISAMHVPLCMLDFSTSSWKSAPQILKTLRKLYSWKKITNTTRGYCKNIQFLHYATCFSH